MSAGSRRPRIVAASGAGGAAKGLTCLGLSGLGETAAQDWRARVLSDPERRCIATRGKSGAQVGLPHSLFLDNNNLDKVCNQERLKAGTCPKGSVYGHARAFSPLLEAPLEGPVYLGVGYGHKLPDLVADLNGQIRILLHARVDTTKHDGLRNTFEVVPDAPVSRFVVQLKGGKKYSLLENSENLCQKTQRASARFIGQNGKVAQLRPVIHTDCKPKKKRKHSQHKKRHRRHR